MRSHMFSMKLNIREIAKMKTISLISLHVYFEKVIFHRKDCYCHFLNDVYLLYIVSPVRPKFSSLRVFIISPCVWVRNPHVASFGSSCSGSLTKLYSKYEQSCSHLRASLGQDQLLSSLTELSTGPSSILLLARDISSLSYGSLHRKVTTWQLASLKERERERAQSRQKTQSFCNLILKAASHHFGCVLFFFF